MAERNAARRAARRSKVQPSHVSRKKRKPKRAPGERYRTGGYHQAVSYGIKLVQRAGLLVPEQHWHPHQLRHSYATRVRRERGLDAARAVLGHRSLAIADTYAELDGALASAVAAELG